MSVPDPCPVLTDHTLLVPFGQFACQIGLIDALDRIPITMKTVDHSPGDKVAELFVHILAGGMHVKELETSPHPVIQVEAVAHAWGQEAFASAPGVNAELEEKEWSARRVGTFYNDRQIAKASIRESKGIFASHHLPTRHDVGIALYQELVLAAQNLLRWFHGQVL